MAKSLDERVTTDLIETLEDGRKGFEHAAQRLADSDRPDLRTNFETFAAQRATMSAELEAMAAEYGDDIDEDGSLGAAAHRGWMSVKDAIAGSDPEGVLTAALTGEDHAVSEFTDALEKDISPRLSAVVRRQLGDITSVRDQVAALGNAAD